MINKRKVRLMARTAMYEHREGNEIFPKAKYYKTDYVGLHMWTTAIAVTVAYLLIILLLATYNFEYLINHLTSLHYTALAVILIMSYTAMLAVFLIIAYIVFSYRYAQAESGVRLYRNRLHKIFQMNKAEKKRKE